MMWRNEAAGSSYSAQWHASRGAVVPVVIEGYDAAFRELARHTVGEPHDSEAVRYRYSTGAPRPR